MNICYLILSKLVQRSVWWEGMKPEGSDQETASF